eukprot:CAMPEP_0197500710 /NCGR_PEP_ID=MMETSP1311-20131121/61664_1 /TAXON_ID=464262 /ORGANISM="Genus nov. species nov., Strain RCC856" /LENGTH=513 /DNA_ID=CAMNT_0043046465 /DNA_START=26 /DNA_END=1563 /DNA_ORIENTATION=+
MLVGWWVSGVGVCACLYSAKPLKSLAKPEEDVPLVTVAVHGILQFDDAEAGAHSVGGAAAGLAVALGGVSLNLLRASQVRPVLVEPVHVPALHGNSDLRRVLKERPADAELAHAVGPHRVRAAERKGLVRGQVANAVGVLARQDDLGLALGLTGVLERSIGHWNEAGGGERAPVEEGQARAQAEPLVHLENVPRPDGRPALEVGRVPDQRELKEPHGVRARTAKRGGWPIGRERAVGQLADPTVHSAPFSLVVALHLLQHEAVVALAVPRVRLVQPDPRPSARDPNHRNLVLAAGATEDHRLLPRVESRGDQRGLVLVLEAEDVRLLVLDLESDVVGGDKEVARGEGSRRAGSFAIHILVLDKDLARGHDRPDRWPPALSRRQAPLQLQVRRLDRLLHHAHLHHHLPLRRVLLRGPQAGNHLHVFVQVRGVHVSQRALAVLEVVVVPALERQRVPDPLLRVVPLLKHLSSARLIHDLHLVDDALKALHGDGTALDALEVGHAAEREAALPVPP